MTLTSVFPDGWNYWSSNSPPTSLSSNHLLILDGSKKTELFNSLTKKSLFHLWNQEEKTILHSHLNHGWKANNTQHNNPHFNLTWPHQDGAVLRWEQGIHQIHSDLKSHQCINCTQSKQHFLMKTSWNEHLYCTYYKIKYTNEKPRKEGDAFNESQRFLHYRLPIAKDSYVL